MSTPNFSEIVNLSKTCHRKHYTMWHFWGPLVCNPGWKSRWLLRALNTMITFSTWAAMLWMLLAPTAPRPPVHPVQSLVGTCAVPWRTFHTGVCSVSPPVCTGTAVAHATMCQWAIPSRIRSNLHGCWSGPPPATHATRQAASRPDSPEQQAQLAFTVIHRQTPMARLAAVDRRRSPRRGIVTFRAWPPPMALLMEMPQKRLAPLGMPKKQYCTKSPASAANPEQAGSPVLRPSTPGAGGPVAVAGSLQAAGLWRRPPASRGGAAAWMLSPTASTGGSTGPDTESSVPHSGQFECRLRTLSNIPRGLRPAPH